MWVSIREYFKSFGRGWVAVLIDYILTPIGAYLDMSGHATFPTPLWITLAVIAGIVAPIIAFHRLREDRDALKGRLEGRPKIEVKPRVHNQFAFLDVRNVGKTQGEFTARGKVILGFPRFGPYTMSWEPAGTISCPINARWGSASIRVAEVSQSSKPQQGILRGDLLLVYLGQEGQQILGVSTTKLTPAKMEIGGELRDVMETKTEDSCVIEVEITSEPPMAEDFGLHSYSLVFDHTLDVLFFTDAPNPDKEDSQIE
jgi:hypothetical protein